MHRQNTVPAPAIECYPLQARHIEPSAVASMDDEHARPSRRLLQLSCEAAMIASTLSLSAVSERMKHPPYWPDVWPGEHYRFLAALTRIINPRCVIEIGTDIGLSALSILSELQIEARFTTFDVIPWQQLPHAVLTENDFLDGRLAQSTDDLTKPEVAEKWHEDLRQADLVFVDAAKDGAMEYDFLELFERVPLRTGAIVVFDDIRLWNMLGVWRSITRSKLDITSFGHWSGTGLVEW